MKILLHHRVSEEAAEQARRSIPPGCSLAIVDPFDRDEFRRRLADSDVLWHVLTPISSDDIAAAPDLKLIHKFGVGVDTIDLDAAQRADVAVCNMPGVNRRAVAEHTLGLMLAALRKLRELDALTRSGRGWSAEPEFFDRIGEIGGSTVGFLGYGQIPQSLRPALDALGAEVIYHRRSGAHVDHPDGYVSLDELYARSDVLSLHLPLTAATDKIIDARALDVMKPGAVLVNTGRGALIEEDALTDALRHGKLAAAGLDVFAQSPLPADHPFFGLPNVTLTPHVAWLTPQTWQRCLAHAVRAVRALTEHHPLDHRIC